MVLFDASQSVCSGACVSYLWDFGDGTTANALRVQHVYLVPGDFNVRLTVTDDKGLQGTSNSVIAIRQADATATPGPGPTNTPVPTGVPTEVPTDVPTAVPTEVPTEEPVPTEPPEEVQPEASFTINPPETTVGEEVVFDASASSGGSSAIVTYQWNFGDGSPTQESSDPVVSHVYSNAGGFQVVLNVINEQSLQNNTLNAVLVTEGEQPPPEGTPEIEQPIEPTPPAEIEQPIEPTPTP